MRTHFNSRKSYYFYFYWVMRIKEQLKINIWNGDRLISCHGYKSVKLCGPIQTLVEPYSYQCRAHGCQNGLFGLSAACETEQNIMDSVDVPCLMFRSQFYEVQEPPYSINVTDGECNALLCMSTGLESSSDHPVILQWLVLGLVCQKVGPSPITWLCQCCYLQNCSV